MPAFPFLPNFKGFSSDGLRDRTNLKFVALRVHDIIGGTHKIWDFVRMNRMDSVNVPDKFEAGSFSHSYGVLKKLGSL